MIKKNSNIPRSRTKSKYKTKEKNISFFFFEVYSFLTIHIVTLLELKQVLKKILNLKIYRTFFKLLNQTERKTKKS